jgi:hypothetical protein
MWRKTTLVAGGLFAACAVAYLGSSSGSRAQSASFDSRWLALDPAQKADRINAPKSTFDGKIYFFDLPTAQTTVVIKGQRRPSDASAVETDGVGRPETDEIARPRPRNGSMRQIPVVPVRIVPRDKKQDGKLLVGCESSFSPVTTPVMANVSSRCLS